MTGRFSALSLRVLPALPGGGGGASPRLSGRRGVSAPHPCGHTRPQVPPRRFLCCFLSGSRSVRLLPHTLGLLSPYYPCYFPDEEINLEPSPLCPHHVTERPGSWRSPEPSLPEQSAPPPHPAGKEREKQPGEWRGGGPTGSREQHQCAEITRHTVGAQLVPRPHFWRRAGEQAGRESARRGRRACKEPGTP